jgi:hypothetical protein
MPSPTTLIAAIAGPLGMAFTLALIVILFLREALPAASGRRARRWRFALSVASAALLLPFVAFIAARLALISAPTLAADLPPTASVARVLTADPTATPTPTGVAPGPMPPVEAPSALPATATPLPPQPAITTPGAPVRVASAVGTLQSGQFEVEIRYANAASSTTIVHFDLGGAGQPPRLHSWTTYQGATGTRTTERVIIGDRSWVRQSGANWSQTTVAESIPQEVAALLPLPGAALSSARADGASALRWYDPARDADLHLELDPTSDLPRRLEQTARGTGTVLTVAYRGWNTPVSILPPTDR